MCKPHIVILADHTIGYRLTKFLLSRNNTDVSIIKIYTNNNTNIWWRSVMELSDTFIVDFYRDEASLFNDLHSKDIEYIFCFSWKHILSKRILQLPSQGTVNLHYSLLPRHRGVYPVNWAIITGDQTTGVTFHFIDEKIDKGRIIAQQKVSISSYYTATQLLKVLDTCAFTLFKRIWKNREMWRTIAYTKSVHSTYHSYKDFEENNEIDLNKMYKAKDFINLLRGKTFLPYANNVFFVDPKTRKKIYINLQPVEEKTKLK